MKPRQPSFLAERASRWWSAPMRFTLSAAAVLRNTPRPSTHCCNLWPRQTPVGIRAPLGTQP